MSDHAIGESADGILRKVDPLALAQVAAVKPAREAVITWSQFRCLVGRFEDGQYFIETRSMDGSEVHQFLLTEEVREMIVESLGRGSDNPADRLIVP